MRYYLGVDWADQTHAVWVMDEDATKIAAHPVPHTAEGLSEWGRDLDQWRAQGLEHHWAVPLRDAIARANGFRIADAFISPLDLVAVGMLASEEAQELTLLTEDYQRQIRQQTRLVNQLTNTLKAYYPRALEIAELTTALAREFLQAYPTPEAATALTARKW